MSNEKIPEKISKKIQYLDKALNYPTDKSAANAYSDARGPSFRRSTAPYSDVARPVIPTVRGRG